VKPEAVEEPKEDGNTPLENAIKKAKGYFDQLNRPVYSTDSALYFEGVSDEDQPGVLIKRIHGENLKGKEFQKYYIDIAKKYGGKIKAYYKYAICLIIDEDNIFQYDGKDIWSEEFYIVDVPHPYFEEGFPLNSLSVHIESGKYYNDIKNYKSKGSMDDGFRKFFSSIKV
jgi:8-oxo-dGTP diphosphatase